MRQRVEAPQRDARELARLQRANLGFAAEQPRPGERAEFHGLARGERPGAAWRAEKTPDQRRCASSGTAHALKTKTVVPVELRGIIQALTLDRPVRDLLTAKIRAAALLKNPLVYPLDEAVPA